MARWVLARHHGTPALLMRQQTFVLALLGLVQAAAVAAPFKQTLSLQGVTFEVQAKGDGSTQLLQVRAHRGLKSYPLVKQELIGQVVGAEVEDLNSDGRPELVVMVQSAGSGSYGSVQAWSAGPHRLEPIPPMGDLSGADARGYMGHDSFNVVETSLVRQFPIYKSSDSNARASGGTRQIVYKMVPAPGGWRFQPVRSTDLATP
ncbi:MAG: PliI family lysozyme inhibitor of I-type lysozyme [Cyanobium sp.]